MTQGGVVLGTEARRTVRRFDLYLLASSLILMTAGLLALYSEGVGRDGGANFKRQVINTIIGLVPFGLFYFVHPKVWRRGAPLLYLAMLGFLMLTLVMGKDVKGAQRWIDIGPLQFQPSEVVKLLAVLTLATFYAYRQNETDRFGTFVLGFLHILVPLILVLLQPHLGAAMVLLVMWFAVSLVAGTPMKFYLVWLLGAILTVGVMLQVPAISGKFFHGYQKGRLQGLVSKTKDVKGSNWQTDRAEIAFGVGGLSGSGFLRGDQKAKHFIPEQRNDFVVTVVGEEGGLIGCSLLLMAYGFFFYRIFVVMLGSAEPYYRMVGAGIFAVLGFHTFVNIAMVIQLLPVVGLWLPFMSSGGTAIWLCMASVGLLLNIRRHERVILF